MNKLDSSTVVQIGLIVRDIEKTAAHYAEVFGIPKPEVRAMCNDEFSHTQYRGEGSTASALGAFFHLGPVEIELIQPVGAPSTWEEYLRTHGEGIHHLAFKTENMGETQKFLAGKGMDLVQTGGWDGGSYAYIEATDQLGLIMELLHFDK